MPPNSPAAFENVDPELPRILLVRAREYRSITAPSIPARVLRSREPGGLAIILPGNCCDSLSISSLASVATKNVASASSPNTRSISNSNRSVGLTSMASTWSVRRRCSPIVFRPNLLATASICFSRCARGLNA